MKKILTTLFILLIMATTTNAQRLTERQLHLATVASLQR